MATYLELRDLFADSSLRNRSAVAAIIAAETIRAESAAVTNHANRLIWAKKVWQSPEYWGEALLKAALAANKTLTVSQLTGVSDASLQTAIDNAVNVFADGTL